MSSSDSSDSSFFSSFFSSAKRRKIILQFHRTKKQKIYIKEKFVNHTSRMIGLPAGAAPAAGAPPPGAAADTATAPPAGTEANLERPKEMC